jgi:hypothetical protein
MKCLYRSHRCVRCFQRPKKASNFVWGFLEIWAMEPSWGVARSCELEKSLFALSVAEAIAMIASSPPVALTSDFLPDCCSSSSSCSSSNSSSEGTTTHRYF